MRSVLVVFVMLFGLSFGAQGDDVRFPSVAVPLPTPSIPTVQNLDSDSLFVIDSDIPLTVLASPRDLVAITADTGALRVRSNFTDSQGKLVTRLYSGKFLYTIEAVKPG